MFSTSQRTTLSCRGEVSSAQRGTVLSIPVLKEVNEITQETVSTWRATEDCHLQMELQLLSWAYSLSSNISRLSQDCCLLGLNSIFNRAT